MAAIIKRILSPVRQQPTTLLLGEVSEDDIVAVCTLLGMVAKANGQETPLQLAEFERLVQRVPSNVQQRARAVFSKVHWPDVNRKKITNIAFQLYLNPDQHWLSPLQLLHALLRMALIDGDLSPAEEEVLETCRATLAIHTRVFWKLRDTLAQHLGVTEPRLSSFVGDVDPLDINATNERQTSEVGQMTLTTKRLAALSALGLKEEASPQEIRAAHRTLIKQYHPDARGSASLSDTDLKLLLQRFGEVQNAYEILVELAAQK